MDLASNIVTIETNKSELKSIEEATGTSYTGRNSLFLARGMRGQGFPFYAESVPRVRHLRDTDCIIMVKPETGHTQMTRNLLKQLADCDLKTAAFNLAKTSQGYILRTEKVAAIKLFLRLPCPETAVNLVAVWPEMLVAMPGANDYLIRMIPKEARGPGLQGLEEWMESFDSNLQAVARIQTFLLREAREGRVTVGFHRMRDQSTLYQRLNRIGIKKGMFANRRQFLRDTITVNPSAFRAVNDMVCITGVNDGRERFWNGLGAESDPQLDLQSEISYEISQSVDAFIAVLDELKRPKNRMDGDE